MNEIARIGVIDDHPIFLSGLRRAFQGAEGLSIVAEGGDKDVAVNMAKPNNVDLMLIDIGIPGGGIEAVRDIIKKHPKMKIIMLTGSDDEDHLEAAIMLGAQGYVLKGATSTELHDAVSAVLAGELYVSIKLAARFLFRQLREGRWQSTDGSKRNLLSPTEQKIADLVSEGLSNREIADQLGLPIGRVKSHMTRILRKLGVRNRIEVMRTQT